MPEEAETWLVAVCAAGGFYPFLTLRQAVSQQVQGAPFQHEITGSSHLSGFCPQDNGALANAVALPELEAQVVIVGSSLQHFLQPQAARLGSQVYR